MCGVNARLATFLVAASFLDFDARATTHIWVSGTGDFAADTSWSTGVPPASWQPIDRVLFDGRFDQSILYGLDQASVRIAELEFGAEYSGNIGNGATPLAIAAETVRFRGTGQINFRSVPTPGAMNAVLVDHYASYGSDNLFGYFDYLVIKKGSVSLWYDADVRNLLVSADNYSSAYATIYAPGPQIPSLVTAVGAVTNYRDILESSQILVTGGSLVQYGRFMPGAKIIQTGGIINYLPIVEPPSDDGPIAEIYGGTLDFSESLYDAKFRFGFVGPQGAFLGNLSTQEMGLVELNVPRPEFDVWLRTDSDADMVFDAFDECQATPAGAVVNQNGAPLGDTDGDCRITLKDFATMQNGMTGP